MEELGYIWVFFDEYGDMCTEFIFIEDEPSRPPIQAIKYSWDHPNRRAKRLAISKALNAELVNGDLV